MEPGGQNNTNKVSFYPGFDAVATSTKRSFGRCSAQPSAAPRPIWGYAWTWRLLENRIFKIHPPSFVPPPESRAKPQASRLRGGTRGAAAGSGLADALHDAQTRAPELRRADRALVGGAAEVQTALSIELEDVWQRHWLA